MTLFIVLGLFFIAPVEATGMFPINVDINAVENIVATAKLTADAFHKRIHAEMRALPELFRNRQRRHLSETTPCMWKTNTCLPDFSHYNSYMQENADGQTKDLFNKASQCQLHADANACDTDKNCKYTPQTKNCDLDDALGNLVMMDLMAPMLEGCDSNMLLKEQMTCDTAPVSDCSSGGTYCKLAGSNSDDQEVAADKKTCVTAPASCSWQSAFSQDDRFGCNYAKTTEDCANEVFSKYPCYKTGNCSMVDEIMEEQVKCTDRTCKNALNNYRYGKCYRYDTNAKCQADSNCNVVNDDAGPPCRPTSAMELAMYKGMFGEECKYVPLMIATQECSATKVEAACQAKTSSGHQCRWRIEQQCANNEVQEEFQCSMSVAGAFFGDTVFGFISEQIDRCVDPRTEADCTAVKVDLSKAPKATTGAVTADGTTTSSAGDTEATTGPKTSTTILLTTSSTTTTTTTTIKTKTCKSVGDPHIYPFRGRSFDNHDVGWKTLYAKGNIMIQGNQMAFIRAGGVAVNGAVRYTTKAKGDLNAASTWQKPNGQTLENPPNPTLIANFADTGSVDAKLVDLQKGIIEFSENFLTLQVFANDYRRFSIAATPIWYDIWVTTNDYAGATGQCTEDGSGVTSGPDGRPPSRRSLETSGGVAFPSDIKVTEAQAETACAAISDVDLRKDCVTDIRMVNNPSFVDKVVGGFKNVEAVDKAIAKTIADKTSTSTTPKVTTTAAVTTVASISAAGRAVTGLGLTALAIIRLLL